MLVDRVLFLDSDIVICDSLEPLWNIPTNNYPLAAVSDRNLDIQRARLGMEAEAPYFNADVMLSELNQWRRENILQRGISFAKSNSDKLDNGDQDVLNHLFENRVQLINQRWNAMSHLWGLDPAWMKAQQGLTKEEQKAHDFPAVIHFAGESFAKPWNYNCTNPRKDDYRQILSQTPWSATGLDGEP